MLQLGLILGLALAALLGLGLHLGARLFSSDIHVLHLINIGIPVSTLPHPMRKERTETKLSVRLSQNLCGSNLSFLLSSDFISVRCRHSAYKCIGICF